MRDSLYIAWKYVRFNKGKSVVLIACIALIAFLPLGLRVIVTESERQLMSRASTTPLVIGAKASALDLVMNTLYFGGQPPEGISLAAAEQVDDSGLALAIPIYNRFEARGHPVVGTTLDYFDFRKLHLSEGREFGLLGECVVGASVAKMLGLSAGDTLVSTPENLFDLAGAYPLKMQIVGVLEPAHSPDDLGVFVDLKTAWIMAGLGHGHEDLAATQDKSVILKREAGTIIANAKLKEFAEVTADNVDSFHFHGDATLYPIGAVLAVPHDEKSRVILMGRYAENELSYQVARPVAVISELIADIFKMERLLETSFLLVGAATFGAVALVFVLSLRLRKGEIETIHKLGCSRMMVAELMAAEIGIILLLAGLITWLAVSLVSFYGSSFVQILISW